MAYIVPRETPKSCHDCQFHYCTEYHPFWSADKEKRNTQTIRCQAVEPFRSTTIDIADKTFKADWCPLVEAADVAPKSEAIKEYLAKVLAKKDIAGHFLPGHEVVSVSVLECFAKEFMEGKNDV